MITNHTQLLNALIEKHGFECYLEIGVQNKANNFDKIDLPWRQKFCVDPEPFAKADFIGTSDQYFTDLESSNKWDLIFIDGLHHADQVKRDFENSLKYLPDNGFIVIHDCLPEKEETTHVPRDSRIWHGDVYKFCMTLNSYNGIKFTTFNIDNGCCVVWKDPDAKALKGSIMPNWDNYLKHKKEAMNISDEVILP